jgi:LAO/AO transport system kinase
MKQLLEEFSEGSVRALARVLTRVENRAPGSFRLLREVFPRSGRARVIGITGSPGSGKSTLVDKLAGRYADADGPIVGIIAVDPSSPYSHGAILGDRIRMQSADTPGKVFIRSMANRGHLGGLAPSTTDVVTVLDAWGIDPILVETVGVGQDEVDIAKLADVSVVVLVPGTGDDIQALKAGIMEIGDIFVINKCDQTGAERLELAIRAALELAPEQDGWRPPIVRTVATTGDGVDGLIGEIDRCHRNLAGDSQRSVRKRRAARERLMQILGERLMNVVLETCGEARIDGAVTAIIGREKDPYSLADEIVESAFPGRPSCRSNT